MQKIKRHFEKPIDSPAFIRELTSTWTHEDLNQYDYLYEISFYRVRGNERLIRIGGEWRNMDDKEIQEDYSKDRRWLPEDYFNDFNPNNEKFNWFVPYWKDKVSELSYVEGMFKELLRHKRRLELQQNTKKELETEKSNINDKEKKS